MLVSALVLGHVIQVVASELDGTPSLFGEVIRATQEDTADEPAIAITHIEESIWPLMKRKFALPNDFDDYGAAFRLLLSHIETTPATRALRFQALHSFHRSMWVVGYMAAALTLVGIALKWWGLPAIRSWPILGMAFGGSVTGILVFRYRKQKMNKLFIQYAIADFYSDQTDEINNIRGETGS